MLVSVPVVNGALQQNAAPFLRGARCSALGNWSAAVPGELPRSKDDARVRELSSISDFTRFYEHEQGCELQTAVVSYHSRRQKFPWDFFQAPQQVDLVAAVHIADKEYFHKMQQELDAYGCVLYEMVADKDPAEAGRTRRWKPSMRKSGRRRSIKFSIISFVQRTMARILNLDFQLECMDYQKDNWYHADLDFKTFTELQRKKGESLLGFAAQLTKASSAALSAAALARDDLGPFRGKLLWASRVLPMPLVGLFIIEGVCAPAPLLEAPEMKALFNLDIGAALKVFLAKQLSMNLFNGAVQAVLKDSVIIGERNRVAMEELKVAMSQDCHRKVAIFYGSGHLPDLDSRLRAMGFYPETIRWQTAWSIKSSRNAGAQDPLTSLAELTGWPLNRYETLSIALLSTVLAIDLWFWELFLETVQETVQAVASL